MLKWFRENKFKIKINTPDYVFGQWGSGFLTGPKFFDVTFESVEGGIIAKTEGWVTGATWLPMAAPIYVPPMDLEASLFFDAGIPRREGLKAMKQLWSTLEALSES